MLTQEAWTQLLSWRQPSTPLAPSEAAETGCKLQLYMKKVPALTPAMHQIPGAPV